MKKAINIGYMFLSFKKLAILGKLLSFKLLCCLYLLSKVEPLLGSTVHIFLAEDILDFCAGFGHLTVTWLDSLWGQITVLSDKSSKVVIL